MTRSGFLDTSDLINRIRYRIRRLLARDYRVSDGSFTYTFRCTEWIELVRARTLLTKEPGTVRWISETVREGDVFYDIGANVGIYSVMAGKRVGAKGAVVAFEPHLGNAMRLLENIGLNGVSDRTIVLSTALHDQSGFMPFHYRYRTTGSSNSQLGSTTDAYGQIFVPESTEIKFAETLDDLLAGGTLKRPPTHIKIDVDGNERRILAGMRHLLAGKDAPRWIQVEVGPHEWEDVGRELANSGYDVVSKTYTALGSKILRGTDGQAAVHFNALFERRSRGDAV